MINEKKIFIDSDESIKQVEVIINGKQTTIDLTSGGFKKYKDLHKIADLIAEDFIHKTVYNPSQQKTYLMSSMTDGQKAGTLSICPSLLVAMRIWAIMKNEQNKVTVKKHIDTAILELLQKIFSIGERTILNEKNSLGAQLDAWIDKIFPEGNIDLSVTKPIFDGSPFEEGRFLEKEKSFIVTISWAVPVFLEIMYLKDEETKIDAFSDKLKGLVKELTKWCLKYIDEATLKDEKGSAVGWNFTKLDNVENEKNLASLYFTYAVSTIYTAFTSSSKYGKIIDALRVKENQKNEENDAIVKAEEILQHPENEKKLEDVRWFNEGKPFSKDDSTDDNNDDELGLLTKLRLRLLGISKTLWERFEKTTQPFANNFFHEDMNGTQAGEIDIMNAGSTNALFTGLLVIGILLTSEYHKEIEQADKSLEKIAYKKFQNKLFVHVAKIQRLYDDLAQENKSFFVDTLIPLFKENFDVETRELADELRKANIKVMPLPTILMKTNHILSENIIQFPQKQMGESLDIIEKRMYFDKTAKRTRMLWETDAYYAISNYYYVEAIFNFYEYYDKYEYPYLCNYDQITKQLETKRFDFPTYKKEFDQLNIDLVKERKEKELWATRHAKLKDQKTYDTESTTTAKQLVENINNVIEKSEFFSSANFAKTMIKGIRTHLADELIKKYGKLMTINEGAEFKSTVDLGDQASLTSLIKALFIDMFLPAAIEGNLLKDDPRYSRLGVGKYANEETRRVDIEIEGRKLLYDDVILNEFFARLCEGKLNWKPKNQDKSSKED